MILWQVRYEAINLFGQNLLNYYFLAMAFVSSLISSLIRKCWDFFFFFSFCRFPSTWCKTTQCYFLLLLFFLVSFLFQQCVCQRIFSRTAEVVWSFPQHIMLFLRTSYRKQLNALNAHSMCRKYFQIITTKCKQNIQQPFGRGRKYLLCFRPGHRFSWL